MLKQCGQCADRWFVAGHNRKHAAEAAGTQVLAQGVVCDFAANERVAHFACAVTHAVRGGHGVFRLHKAKTCLSLTLADACAQRFVDGFNLVLYTEVALAVAARTDHTDRWLVDQIEISIELARYTVGLGVAARVVIEADNSRAVGHRWFQVLNGKGEGGSVLC